MSRIETRHDPELASVFSLISGILILAGAVTSWIWHTTFTAQMGWMMGMQNFMPIVTSMLTIGIISGALVLFGAIMMRYRPSERYIWGILVFIFAIVSLLGMGGFLLGAALGIVGGILAIVKR